MGNANQKRGSKIVVGRIEGVRSHPHADRIFIALVSIDTGERLQIIFGGSRMLSAGTKVAVALPGARLPSGDRIRRRRYRGEYSEAELLSSDELGWTADGPDAVFVLDDIFTVGTQLFARCHDVDDKSV